eukprot:m.71099 g.71099  ORF g.71099 m.71099 type:complete len:492 (-) comp14135_c0_seq1:191-1666(-)
MSSGDAPAPTTDQQHEGQTVTPQAQASIDAATVAAAEQSAITDVSVTSEVSDDQGKTESTEPGTASGAIDMSEEQRQILLEKQLREDAEAAKAQPFRLLVIDSTAAVSWYGLFQNHVAVIDADTVRPIQVEQAGWDDVTLTSYPDSSGCVCILTKSSTAPIHPNQSKQRSFKPDLVLVRNTVSNLLKTNCLNLLFGFRVAGIPCVNSADSMLLCTHRPWVYAALRDIERRLGHDQFPLIHATYYPTASEMIIDPGLPAVVKIGSTHAGLGKMMIKDTERWDDLRSVIAVHDDFATAEPFVEYDADYRVQKIGDHIRVLKRQSIHWKVNRGFGTLEEDAEVTEAFRRWVTEAAKVFGGLDICALDVLYRESDNSYHILELNDTSIGLSPRLEQEDSERIRDLVMDKINCLLASRANEEAAASQAAGVATGSATRPEASTDDDAATSEVAALKLKISKLTAKNEQLEQQRARLEADNAALSQHQPAPRQCNVM